MINVTIGMPKAIARALWCCREKENQVDANLRDGQYDERNRDSWRPDQVGVHRIKRGCSEEGGEH